MSDEKNIEQGDYSSSSDMLKSIREHYESGEPLNDAELDFIADNAVSVVRFVLNCFDAKDAQIDEYDGDDGELILDIHGGNLAVLIGRHGRVLEAFQLLSSSLFSKRLGFHFPIVIDIEGYIVRRREKINQLAKSAARKAVLHGSSRLKPMSAYERRLVHLALVDNEDVTTHSEGDEPERYVVVTAVR